MQHNRKRTWKRYRVTYINCGTVKTTIIREESVEKAREIAKYRYNNIVSVELIG